MIGERIKILRKTKGLSQEELAKSLCVSRQTVSKWENGNSVPDAEVLVRMADVFQVTASELLAETVEKNSDDTSVGNQLSKIREELEVRNERNKRIRGRVKAFIFAGIVILLIILLLNCAS